MLLSTNPDFIKKITLWGNYNDFPKALKKNLRNFKIYLKSYWKLNQIIKLVKIKI